LYFEIIKEIIQSV